MDKNQIIGIVLIFLLLIGYGIFTRPSEEELIARQEKIDSLKRVEAEKYKADSLKNIQDSILELQNKQIIVVKDSTVLDTTKKMKDLESQYGIFANSAEGKEEFITLKNKNIKVKITTKGAFPYFVELTQFTTFDKKPLILFDNRENSFALKLFSNNKRISTDSLFFKNVTGDTLLDASEKPQSISLRVNVADNKYIEYKYTLEPESYLLKYDIRFYGLENELASNSSYIDMLWKLKMRRQEKGADWENQNSTVYYKHFGDDVKYLSEMSDDKKEVVDTRLKWISYKDHFFSSVLIAKEHFDEAEMSYVKDNIQEKYIKNFESTIAVPFDRSNDENYGFVFYFGPNDYDILRKIKIEGSEDLNLKRMIPLGWAIFRWVNQFIIIPMFNLLGNIFGSNMGLIILIMTILIKIALFPLTFKSYKSSAKMRVLKPQIEEINKKIPKDKAMERQQATMALYRKVGVNPMGGCLPLLLQFPFLIAMFRFFPASIELRQKSFLWADDLSSYDSIWDFPGGFSIPMYGDHISLFALLMAVAMLISSIMNQSQMNTGSQQMPGMKFMLYLMPVMMLLWFNKYSAGLSYYYFLSNVITIAQTLIIRRMTDEKALLEQLNAFKAKPKKKSKWQARIEEMQKMQQQRLKK
jgi:YidC/Oxa1 family membrane protein insertase